jgi:hypothetical protein
VVRPRAPRPDPPRRRRASLRTRLLAIIALMLLPLVALSAVAAFTFDLAVSRFAEAAGEAEREAIPLARLSSSLDRSLVLSLPHGSVSGQRTSGP